MSACVDKTTHGHPAEAEGELAGSVLSDRCDARANAGCCDYAQHDKVSPSRGGTRFRFHAAGQVRLSAARQGFDFMRWDKGSPARCMTTHGHPAEAEGELAGSMGDEPRLPYIAPNNSARSASSKRSAVLEPPSSTARANSALRSCMDWIFSSTVPAQISL